MATMVGKETDVTKLLNDLIALDFDAIEAYEAAISRLSMAADKDQLTRFMADHQRHVRDLSDLVRGFGQKPTEKADIKKILTKGKVVIAGLIDDDSVLKAMRSNEDDTNKAYERATQHVGLAERVLTVLQTNLSDERRHWDWLEKRITGKKAATAHP